GGPGACWLAGSRATRRCTSGPSGLPEAGLEATAACARPGGGDGVRLGFERVVQRLELGRLAPGAVRQRLGEQPIREPRIAGEERSVEVGADRTVDPAALEPAPAVVGEGGDHPAARPGAPVQNRPAAVIRDA